MALPLYASLKAIAEDRPLAFIVVLVGIMTLCRLILLPFYQSNLGPDEAQYWFWGQTLDWGYYSKPPMIAWVIAMPTRVFGDHEWSVRLLSPLLIGATALFLFMTARRLYGDQAARWTAVLWLTLPAVMFGATIMSTDIPLLLFWSLSLWALVGLSDAQGGAAYRWALLLGASIGFGFLSKYAMIYFPIGWVLALFVSDRARRTMKPGPVLLAAGMGALIFAPNLAWNARHGFQTLSHTADNANWGADLLNPEELLQFLGDQFGVAGPLLFLALFVGVVTLGRRLAQAGPARGRDLMLLAFILPPLVIISGQALLSRAHANWAMAAYPAAMILLPVWAMRAKAKWVLIGSVGLHSVIGLAFTAILLDFTLADRLGQSNSVKRVRGWTEQMAQIRQAAEGQAGLILDDREIAAHLVWEMRADPIPLQVFDLNDRLDNTYEHAFPVRPGAQNGYLLATQNAHVICRYKGFATITPAGQSFVDLKATRRGRAERSIDLFYVADYRAFSGNPCA